MIRPVIALLLLTNALTGHAASNDGMQSHDEVIRTVEKYARDHVAQDGTVRTEIAAQYLDNRLRLASCDAPLEAFSDNLDFSSSRLTVGVRCEGTKTWKVYVPVQINRFAKIAVATQTLKLDQPLQAEHLAFVERKLEDVGRGYIFTPEQGKGQIVKQTVFAGTPVYVSALKAAPLVKRGEHVIIVANTQGLTVKMAGAALADGGLGQTVKVKNLSSARTIEARVVDYAMVEVQF